MASPGRNQPGQSRLRARRSIANVPTSEAGIQQENMTADLSTLQDANRTVTQNERKKSRSKSLGPGGLDALKDESEKRKKSTVTPIIKSILKPTLPISPPKAIPSFESTRKRSPSKANSKGTEHKTPNEGVLIDFLSAPLGNNQNAPVRGAENLANPFDALQPNTVAVRTEEEQHAAVREREEKERRDQQRQSILDQRAARRKSLANRRVSFAPEATLHTWVNMEVGEDSTTSSASTNSTRRASSLTAPATPKLPNSDPSGPPLTPPEQVEEPASKASPGHQRDLHQKKRRRSSGIPPMNFNNPDDERFSSSPFSGSSVAGSDDTGHSMPAGQPDSSDSDSDVADGEDTGMSIVSQDATGDSAGSASSTSSSTRLDQALRLAAVQAGTRGIEFDEHGGTEMEMEMADEEITASFQPWVKKGVYQPKSVEDLSSLQGQENLNPFSPAFRVGTGLSGPQVPSQKEDESEEMSMDVTKAVGGILKARSPKTSPKVSPKASPKERRKSIANARRSSIGRRQSDISDMDDATMEFTTAVGGIQRKLQQAVPAQQNDESAFDEDEDMTMEFTGVIGGMINNQAHNATKQTAAHAAAQENVSGLRRESIGSIIADDSMDMTAAVGGILAPIEERTEPQDTQTIAMDVTTAIGGILPPELHTNIKSQAKKLMELETDAGQLTSSPFQEKTSPISPPKSVPKSATPKHLATIASETGSPSLTSVRTRGAGRKSGEERLPATPKFSSQPGTPVKGPSTPSKQLTPLPGKPTNPGKTPPMSNVTFRSASPKKLFKAEIKKSASTPKSTASQKPSTPDKLFDTDAITGQATPSIILRPGRRRSSGLGIDKENLGSPQVEALFDRRGSLGEDARKFIAEDQPTRGVHFDNPILLSQELDLEREEEGRRESGRGILEREADFVDQNRDDEEDRTANLKDMIQSMTPKKEHHYEAMYPKGKKPNGRKSIAPGGAKGLLGKRPVELNSDEEDADVDSTPKRLKGREGSPVKNIKLPTPSQNMGKMTRAGRKSVVAMNAADTITPTTFGSPIKSYPTITTPKHQGRFKDAEGPSATKPTSFEEKIDAANQLSLVDDTGLSQQEEEQERIHLQDFLNMTNIHFMELTTTKRRHTTAPGSAKKPSAFGQGGGAGQASLEDCVVAALCTVPMLELYQHSCRELKSYISEGRRLIRSIETSTFEEQPPLFREYLSADPDVRLIMDTQFRNVKTHARLSSKGMWYEWRMKLLEGLKEGLDRHVQGIDSDELVLQQEESALGLVVQKLVSRFETLEEEARVLRLREEEAENEDAEEKIEVKELLDAVEQQLSQRMAYLRDLEKRNQDNERSIETNTEIKGELEAQIKEAEKVREECRGWSAREVNEARASATALEKTTGWSIVAASEPGPHDQDFGTALTLTYRDTLHLFLHPEAFLTPSGAIREDKANNDNAPISLTFSSPNEKDTLTTEKRFLLQLMQGYMHSIPQATTTTKHLLGFVAGAWDTAAKVSQEVQALNRLGITSTEILGDEVLGTRCMVMMPESPTRVDVAFKLSVRISETGNLNVDVKANAGVVYGALNSSTADIAGTLRKAIRSTRSQLGDGVWADAVRSVVLESGSEPKMVAQTQLITGKKSLPRAARTGSQTPGPAMGKTLAPSKTPATAKKLNIQSPGRKVLSGVSGNIPAVTVSALSTSTSSVLKGRSLVKSRSPVKTPPGTATRARKAQLETTTMAEKEEENVGIDVGSVKDVGVGAGVGIGIDANGMTTPVKLRRGGIPRTPPMAVGMPD